MKAHQIRIPGRFNPGNQRKVLFGKWGCFGPIGLVRPKCFVLFENFVTFCDLLQASDTFLVKSLFLRC